MSESVMSVTGGLLPTERDMYHDVTRTSRAPFMRLQVPILCQQWPSYSAAGCSGAQAAVYRHAHEGRRPSRSASQGNRGLHFTRRCDGFPDGARLLAVYHSLPASPWIDSQRPSPSARASTCWGDSIIRHGSRSSHSDDNTKHCYDQRPKVRFSDVA